MASSSPGRAICRSQASVLSSPTGVDRVEGRVPGCSPACELHVPWPANNHSPFDLLCTAGSATAGFRIRYSAVKGS